MNDQMRMILSTTPAHPSAWRPNHAIFFSPAVCYSAMWYRALVLLHIIAHPFWLLAISAKARVPTTGKQARVPTSGTRHYRTLAMLKLFHFIVIYVLKGLASSQYKSRIAKGLQKVKTKDRHLHSDFFVFSSSNYTIFILLCA